MARNVTLSQLRTDIAAQADFVTSATGRYTPTFLTRRINQSIQRFRERICAEGIAHYLVSTSGTLTAGATSPYSFRTLDLSAVSPSIVRVFGVDITYSNVVSTLAHRPFQERNDFGGPSTTGIPRAWAAYGTRSVAVMPAPDQSYSYTVWYLPVLADLSADGDTFDGVAGWEDWIVWDVVCQVIARDTYPTAYQQATQMRLEAWEDIKRSGTKVTAAGGAIVGRDTLRSTFLRGRSFDQIAGSSLTPAPNTVTNAMLVDMPEERIKGRARAAGAGSPQDLTPAQAAGAVQVYSGLSAGLVPTGANGTTLFLREDATWAAPSVGGSVSGLLLSQIQNLAAPRVVGRFAGTGAPEQLLGQQVASMIGVFSGSVHGLVPYPSGGAAGLVLSDAGTWVAQSGGGAATAASPSGIFLFPPLSVLGNPLSGSGVSDFLNRGQVASLLPLFGTASGTTRGLVYSPTAGVANRFLRDDGSFQGVPSVVPTGVLLSQLELANPLNILGRFTLGTGAIEQLPPGRVASLLPDFFVASGGTRGLVWAPTGGTAGRFLRDDGSFQGIPSNIPTGIEYNQLAAMPEGVLGRFAPSGVPTFLSGSAVGTMLPLFNNVDKGAVPGSGGGTTNFLRADQTWAAPPGGGGAANNPGLPTMSVQFNLGSGIFGGSTGLLFDPTGLGHLQLSHNLRMPTGTVLLGATGAGAAPVAWLAGYSGALNIGLGTGLANPALAIENPAEGNPGLIRVRAWDVDGQGTPREAIGIDRSSGSGALQVFFGHPTESLVGNLRGRFAAIFANGATGTIRGRLGANSLEAFAARPGHHAWGVSGSQRLGLDERGLHSWGQVGVQPLAHSDTLDKLTTVTPSGFVNVATGLTIGASGYRLSVGSGGPQLHASGIDLRSGDIRNVRRLNGVDGIKAYGELAAGGGTSGAVDVYVSSGTIFQIPLSETVGHRYNLVPSALHGEVVIIDNRSAATHWLINTGTGMGAPSALIKTMAPSGGVTARFASGAWEYGVQYKLGGF